MNKLQADFPCLFHAVDSMPGEGWEPLLRRLSERLTARIQAERSPQDYYAVQVKEKFGGLRFYMSQYTDEMGELIRDAEAESRRTCETCGAPGKIMAKRSWLKAACEKHA